MSLCLLRRLAWLSVRLVCSLPLVCRWSASATKAVDCDRVGSAACAAVGVVYDDYHGLACCQSYGVGDCATGSCAQAWVAHVVGLHRLFGSKEPRYSLS